MHAVDLRKARGCGIDSEEAMAKALAVVENGEGAAHVPIFDQPEGTDWFLAWLIGLANDHGIEQGITLTIGGMSLTGQLISGHSYFKEIGERISRANFQGGPETSETLRSALVLGYSQWCLLYPEAGAPTNQEKPQASYIHLRDAKVVTPDGQVMPTTGALWRGKLSAVSGYMLGQCEPLHH